MSVPPLLASIPSPSSGVLEIGPLSLNAYGLMIALGVVAAVWLFGRRLEERHIGTRDDANAIGVWGVVAGVIGARLYHVFTDWHRFEGNWFDVVKVWEGGLGIPGGMLAGVLAGVYVGHRRGIPIGPGLNAVAPALPLAQAIGRWGNYFNQELYGRPTDLPWALEIDDEHLPATGQYPSGTTFHPTFLYESLWNLGLVGLILWLDKRYTWAGGQLLRGLRHGLRRRAVVDREPADRRGGRARALALEPVGRPRAHRRRRRVPARHERLAGERVYEAPPVPVDTDEDDTAAIAMVTADLRPDLDDDDDAQGGLQDAAADTGDGDDPVDADMQPAIDDAAGDEGIGAEPAADETDDGSKAGSEP